MLCCLRKRGRGEVILMQMITRKCAMLIWARRGVGGVSMCLEGSGFLVARGSKSVRLLAL